jgi:hypothetical protein
MTQSTMPGSSIARESYLDGIPASELEAELVARRIRRADERIADLWAEITLTEQRQTRRRAVLAGLEAKWRGKK